MSQYETTSKENKTEENNSVHPELRLLLLVTTLLCLYVLTLSGLLNVYGIQGTGVHLP